MRITLSIDDDLAILLKKLQKDRGVSFKQIMNEALRHGLQQTRQPASPKKPFRTQFVALGKCHFPNLDNTWEVLSEGKSYK